MPSLVYASTWPWISAWKAAGWSGNSRSCALGAFSRMIRALVEPCWAAMRLPSMSLMLRTLLPFFTMNCAPVTKKVREKSTLSRRVRVSVMVSAIRSTALDDSSGMRVGGADSLRSTLTGFPSFFSRAGLISSSTRSMEKPTHWFWLFTYAKGGDPVRVPITSVPLWLILSSVLEACAKAGVTEDTSSATATTRAKSFFMHCLLEGLVGQDLREEVAGAVRFRGREELLGGGGLDDLAVIHEDHAVRDALGEAHLVRHHHHGHAFLGQIGHDVEHLVDHLGIEGRGRLVEEHDPRLHGQSAGDGHALLLASREIGGILVGLVRDPDAREEVAGDLLRLGGGEPLHLRRRQHDVLEHRHVREEVEGLEHHADLGPELGEVDPVAGDGIAVDEDLALLDGLELVDAADERALARARGSAHHHDLARRHVEIDVLEHLHRAKPLADLRVADGGRARGCHGYSTTIITSPGFTAWPTSTRISLTVPATDALNSFSIFMASRITRPSPGLTD